jgi:precorrin-2 dehydrogenase/sirohydrochlorin ferrochelatase
MFVSLHERVCLVIGGGTVGERKVRGLLGAGATVRLVAQDLTPWLEEQCKHDLIALVGGCYRSDHLKGVELVFVATNDPELNSRIAGEAREKRLWCNMATDPEQGSFVVPSVVRRGPLTIAISTSGLSPAVAKLIRERLEEEFGEDWGGYLRLLGVLRERIQSEGLDSSQNQNIFREISRLPLLRWIESGHKNQALGAIRDACRPWLGLDELNRFWDEIWKPSS